MIGWCGDAVDLTVFFFAFVIRRENTLYGKLVLIARRNVRFLYVTQSKSGLSVYIYRTIQCQN